MLQFFPRQSQMETLQIIESPEGRKEVYPTGFEHRFLEPDRDFKTGFGFLFLFVFWYVCVAMGRFTSVFQFHFL